MPLISTFNFIFWVSNKEEAAFLPSQYPFLFLSLSLRPLHSPSCYLFPPPMGSWELCK